MNPKSRWLAFLCSFAFVLLLSTQCVVPNAFAAVNTVTYDYGENGGSAAEVDLTLKGAEKGDWDFLGWNTEKDATTELSSLPLPLPDPLRLYAIYTKNLPVVFRDYNATEPRDRTIQAAIYNNNPGGEVVPPEQGPFTGWMTRGWSASTEPDADPALSFPVSITDTAPPMYYGLYKRPITLSYETEGGVLAEDSYATSGIQYINSLGLYKNPELTVRSATKSGADLDYWALNSPDGVIRYHPGSLITIDGDATLYAVWKYDEYTVTFNYGANGGTEPDTGEVLSSPMKAAANATLNLPLTADKGNGWQFLGWNTDRDARTGWLSHAMPPSPSDRVNQPDPGYADPCNELENWQRPEDIWRIENGKLVRDPVMDGYRYAQFRNTQILNGVVSAKFTIDSPSGPGNPYAGLAVRQKAGAGIYNSGYIVYVGCKNNGLYVNVAKGKPAGNGGDAFDGQADKRITIPEFTLGQQVEITIVMEDDHFVIKANGVEVFDFTDPDFRTDDCDHVRLLAANTRVSFYDLQIYSSDITLYAIYEKELTANFQDINGSRPVPVLIYNNDTEGQADPPEQGEYAGWTPGGWSGKDQTAANAEPVQTFPVSVTDAVPPTYYGLYERQVTLTYFNGGEQLTDRADTRRQYANSASPGTFEDPVFTLAQAPPAETDVEFVGWAMGSASGPICLSPTLSSGIDITLHAVWRILIPASGLDYVKGAKVTPGTDPGPGTMNIFTSDDDFIFDITLQKATGTDSWVNWTITDYFHEPVRTGTAYVPAGQLQTTVPAGCLNTGHYIVEAWVPGERVTDNFAVVPPLSDPAIDSPFGMDTSVLTARNSWNDAANYKLMFADLAWAVRRSGVPWVSQRMNWQSPGNLNQAELPLGYLNQEGLKVLSDLRYLPQDNLEDETAVSNAAKQQFNMLPDNHEQFMSLPTNLRNAYMNKLPGNLRMAYNEAAEKGTRYQNQISAWALWNEPSSTVFDNLGIGTGYGEGADRYAAVLKAMSIGFHDSAMPNPLVSMGGMMPRIGTYGSYQDTMFENGVMDYLEIYSFHNHQPNANPAVPRIDLGKYDGSYDNHMLSLTKNTLHLQKKNELENNLPNGAGTSAWLTEAGGAIPYSPGQGAASPEGLDGSYDKQKAQARYWVTSAAMSLSTGVDRHFWYSGKPGEYETNQGYPNVYWSCFSPTRNLSTNQGWVTPYAAYAAAAAMIEVLGEAKYAGEVSLSAGAYGYAFRDRGDTVLVLWSDERMDDVALDLQKPEGIRTDIMGVRETEPVFSANGEFRISLDKDPIYLKVQGDIPAGAYKDTSQPHTPTAPASKPFTPAQRIVLDQTFPAESRSHDVKRAQGYILKTNQPTTIEVAVYNFNDFEISGTVTGCFDSDDYIIIGEATKSVTVGSGAEGQQRVTFTVMAVGTPKEEAAKLSFTGDFDGVGQTTPSVAKVLNVQPAPEFMGQANRSDPCADITKWDAKSFMWEVTPDGRLTHDPTSNWKHAHYRGAQVNDGVVSTKLTINSSVGNTGLLVRQDTGKGVFNTGYVVFVKWNTARQCFVLEVAKGKTPAGDAFDNVRPDLKGHSILGSALGKEMEITVVMKGDRIDVYVDDAWITGFNDDAFIGSSYGYAGPLMLNAEASFRDFKVYADPCSDINNWELPDNSQVWRNEAGKLVRDPNGDNNYYRAQLKNTEVVDGVVSTKYTLENLPGSGILYAGLAVRQTAGAGKWNSGYIVFTGYSSNGLKVEVAKGKPGGNGADVFGYSIEQGGRPDLKNHIIQGFQPGQEIEITIFMEGNHFIVMVNGEEVFNFHDYDNPFLTDGYVRLLGQNAKVSFYDFDSYES
ncbi:MAG: InlB B-repeat-containing protein [Peptococcaceae bacterium]|nr:InlB B-repeat-containing protein [Peptococcaceae bacterium]